MIVEVVLATPVQNWSVELEVEDGSTAADAIALAYESEEFAGAEGVSFDAIGVWGTVVGEDYVLMDDDRVELLRKLPVDPFSRRRKLSEQS